MVIQAQSESQSSTITVQQSLYLSITIITMNFLKIPVITIVIFSLISCTDSQDDSIDVSIKGEAIHIQNFTGHLIRRSGELCGEGITVVMVLSSENDKREYTYEADTYRDAVIDIKKGEKLSVTAFEVQDGQRIFLTQKSEIYDPPSDKDQFVQPIIRLCPKDNISFFEFNEN